MNSKLEIRPTTLDVLYHEFHPIMAEIDEAGGFVHAMKIQPTGYILSIRWPENTAGDAPGYKAEAPPVQHDSITTQNNSHEDNQTASQ